MRDETSQQVRRRQFLAGTAGVAGLAAGAGCTEVQQQTGATDVVVHNAADSRTVSMTITAADSNEPHTSRTLALDPGETVDAVNRSKLPTNTSYTIDVSVENGASESFEWDDPAVERAPLWVFLDGSRNIKFLLQAG